MRTVQQPIALFALIFWLGFISSISFMESWLKFQAPGITLPLGLGIGRMVFAAMNKVEWVVVLIIFSNLLWTQEKILHFKYIALFIPVVILLLQTFWLLPALDARAQMHIDGLEVPPSNLHFIFPILEVVKAICLLWMSISLFKKPQLTTS